MAAPKRRSFIRHALLSTAVTAVLGLSWATFDASAAEPVPAHAEAAPGDAELAPTPGAVPIVGDGVPVATPAPAAKSLDGRRIKDMSFLEWLERFAPIVILLVAIVFILLRLPRVELGHSDAFRRRRVMNWLPLGLTYAFLYMARYNLNVAKTSLGDLMPLDDFALIFGVGTAVYGLSFVLNGPLADRFGGKKVILVSAFGSAVANILMGVVTAHALGAAALAKAAGHPVGDLGITPLFTVLYAVNMYFQSFGAVAIVKVNAPWFHVQERGVFGAIFGILISLGIYFAYDWSEIVVSFFPIPWVFFVPAMFLAVFFVLDVFLVKNTPGEAGFDDFDTADASSGDDGPRLPVLAVMKMMVTNPIILTIAAIEFCSGFLRQAIMQLYKPYVKAIANPDDLVIWVYQNWGLLLCAAGIVGGTVAGIISDRVFDSRRGPVAALLYGVMIVSAVVGSFLVGTPFIGLLVVFMSFAIIGVHGMLSGTASMDFGGKKNVGIAVGLIDGCVYLGTAVMSLVYGGILPGKEIDPATGQRADLDPANWNIWPIVMIPVAIVGFVLATRIWNAKPKGKAASAH